MDVEPGTKPLLDFVSNDNKEETTPAEDYEAMFGEMRYFGWMAYGIMSVLSYGYYSQKFYTMQVAKETQLPAAYHTFWGFGEYLRIFTNMTVSMLQGLAWVGTFLPVPQLHTVFKYSTQAALMVHVLKYFGLIIAKGGSFFADNTKRDYDEGISEGMFDQKMFADDIDDYSQAIDALDGLFEMIMLGGQLVAGAAISWTDENALKRVKLLEKGEIDEKDIIFGSKEPEWFGLLGPENLEI